MVTSELDPEVLAVLDLSANSSFSLRLDCSSNQLTKNIYIFVFMFGPYIEKREYSCLRVVSRL